MTYFIQGSLSFANILLAVFVLFFAISFLRKTKENRDRNPWIFLLIAVVVFFCIQILKVLELMGHINLNTYMFYLDSMFIAIVLFTFIFQYNLILSSELIQIKRKTSSSELESIQSDIKTVEKIEKELKKKKKNIVSKNKSSKKSSKTKRKSRSK